MTTSAKNVVAHLQNVGNYLINPNNYDDNNYDDNNYGEVTQSKSLSHGSDFYKFQMSLKNRTVEGFNGQDTLTHASQSVLSKTHISTAQQNKLAGLKAEYVLNQTSYNSLINNISPSDADNSAKFAQLTQLETTLDRLVQKINNLNNRINKNVDSVNNQILSNSIAREEYVDDITSNNTNKSNMLDLSNNIQNMLNDSDITTLQKNYSYILVSILAAASIIVAMNVIKNN